MHSTTVGSSRIEEEVSRKGKAVTITTQLTGSHHCPDSALNVMISAGVMSLASTVPSRL